MKTKTTEKKHKPLYTLDPNRSPFKSASMKTKEIDEIFCDSSFENTKKKLDFNEIIFRKGGMQNKTKSNNLLIFLENFNNNYESLISGIKKSKTNSSSDVNKREQENLRNRNLVCSPKKLPRESYTRATQAWNQDEMSFLLTNKTIEVNPVNSTLKDLHDDSNVYTLSTIKSSKVYLDQEDYEIFDDIVTKCNKASRPSSPVQRYYDYSKSCLRAIENISPPTLEELEPYMTKLSVKEKALKKKKLLIFDLDETLVYCDNNQPGDICLEIELPHGIEVKANVSIRPGLLNLLNEAKENFVMIVFSASHQLYADAVLDYIDPEGIYFKQRLYRHNCFPLKISGTTVYIKDLRVIKHLDLKNTVIVDNSILSFAFQLDNGIPILDYMGNKDDEELKYLSSYLKHLSKCDDVRTENNRIFKLDSFLNKSVNKNGSSSSNFLITESSNMSQEIEKSLILTSASLFYDM